MGHKKEEYYHITEAINHLRHAAGNLLKNAPAEPQLTFRPQELAGNELLLIADHLENVRTFTAKQVVQE